jgi:hypothetical protein
MPSGRFGLEENPKAFILHFPEEKGALHLA